MARAAVIGAGPTGLATAMLLAQWGIEVTVLDRDPPGPDTADEAWESWERRSVAQFRQVHYFQPRGRVLLEQHLPSVLGELSALGVAPWNMVAGLAQLVPGGPGDLDFRPFETVTTCRRPVLELAFLNAARAIPGIEVRNDCVVSELVTGPSAVDNVVHVVRVRTESGEMVPADVVVDVAGRRTPVPALLEKAGARRPPERAEDVGFVYNTQFYRGDGQPELRGDALAAVGSISILTMPGDRGHWSVTLYHSPSDRPMRKVRRPEVFDRVVRSLPLHAHWADGRAVGGVRSMASTANATRRFVVDGQPCATGLVPVGDAWGFTNPSLGRGISLGIMHAVGVVDAVAAHLDQPAEMAAAWDRVTEAEAVRWHDATVQFDRVREPEVEAYREGRPDPHDPSDMMVAAYRAFDSARHYDAQVLH